MARLSMVEQGGLGDLLNFLSLAIKLSNSALEDGKYSRLWLAVESLSEMGILDKEAFTDMVNAIHDYADEAIDISQMIEMTLQQLDP